MSGITLKHVTPATIPTPSAGKSTIFINDSDADTPYYKDPSGTSTSLKGAAGDGYDDVQAHGNTGATETFDYATADFHTATLDANCTFTFTGATNGILAILGLRLTQDGTGSRLVTWPGSVVWAEAGTAPTLQTAAASVDELWFDSTDGGTTWYGHYGRLPLTTRGDLLTRSATANTRLAIGSSGKFLSSDGTDPSWGQGPLTTTGDLLLGASGGTPTRLAAGTSGYVLTSNGASTNPSWQAAAGGGISDDLLPWNIDILPKFAKANTNWSTDTGGDGLQWMNYGRESTGAQNAEVTWDVVLADGTWTVELVFIKGTDRGIFSVQFDSVEKGTIDSYNGSLVRNQTGSVAGITVGTTAKIELKLKMATKNASSSSYYGTVNIITLRRTA